MNVRNLNDTSFQLGNYQLTAPPHAVDEPVCFQLRDSFGSVKLPAKTELRGPGESVVEFYRATDRAPSALPLRRVPTSGAPVFQQYTRISASRTEVPRTITINASIRQLRLPSARYLIPDLDTLLYANSAALFDVLASPSKLFYGDNLMTDTELHDFSQYVLQSPICDDILLFRLQLAQESKHSGVYIIDAEIPSAESLRLSSPLAAQEARGRSASFFAELSKSITDTSEVLVARRISATVQKSLRRLTASIRTATPPSRQRIDPIPLPLLLKAMRTCLTSETALRDLQENKIRIPIPEKVIVSNFVLSGPKLQLAPAAPTVISQLRS